MLNFKRTLIVLFCCSGMIYSKGQDSIPLLKELVVTGIIEKDHIIGVKVIEFDSTALASHSSIADLLTNSSSVYIKQQGKGMLSTITLRGTGASHTSLFWNGFDVNYSTLGLSDFGVIPTLGFDEMGLVYGSGATMYGNGALGGIIKTINQPDWGKGVSTRINYQFGSYNFHSFSGQSGFSSKKWSFSTNVYSTTSNNDFTFINTEKFDSPTEQQQNAKVQSGGLIQEVFFRPTRHQILSYISWYNQSHREVQAIMSSNNAADYQWDRSWKNVIGFKNYYYRGYTELKLAYINDYIRYVDSTKGIDAPSDMKQWGIIVEHKHNFKNYLHVKLGGQVNYYTADLQNYAKGQDDSRASIYLSTFYQLKTKFQFNLNIKQAFFRNQDAPFSPSIGINYQLLNKGEQVVKIKSSLSRNYRAPTLNERYWIPGGNPDILPESGWSGEIGMVYGIKKEHVELSTEFTGFYMRINNWVQWLADSVGLFTPVNIDRVKSRGVENVTFLKYQKNNWKLKLSFNYAYTIATNVLMQSATDNGLGKQLIYVPVNSWNVSGNINWKKYYIQYGFNYTGHRFTTRDNTMSLPDYGLSSIHLGKGWRFKTYSLETSLRINNLLNIPYLNTAQRAMPGRNYTINVSLNI